MNIKDLVKVSLEELGQQEGTSGETGPEVGTLTVYDIIEMDESRQEYESALSEVEEGERDLDVLQQSGDDIEKMVVSTEALVANGGMDVQAAHTLMLRMNRVYSAIGMEHFVAAMPSMESFGGETTRLNASMEALADLKQKAAAVGNAILEQLKKVIEFISNFIGSVLKSVGTLEKRAKALVAAAKAKSKAGAKAEGDMPNYNAGAVAYDGKADVNSVIKGLDRSRGQVSGFLEGAVEAQEAFNEIAYIQFVKMVSFGNEEEELTALEEKISNNPKLKFDMIGGITSEWKEDKLVVARKSQNIPGDKSIPSLSEIEAIGEIAAELCVVLASKKTELNKLKDLNKALGDKAKGKLGKTQAKVLAWSVRRGLVTAATRVCNGAYSSASAALSYGEKALKQYKVTEAK
jgi:hypothetical protein